MTGVLEFYNANLESIMQYRDLKTEVFQAFREVGNIILFCLRVEEQLVRTSQSAKLNILRYSWERWYFSENWEYIYWKNILSWWKKIMEWLKCFKFPTTVVIELSMKTNNQKLGREISSLISWVLYLLLSIVIYCISHVTSFSN